MEHISTILENQSLPENPKKDLHQRITDTIIEQLEKGVIPWQMPWRTINTGNRLPKNAITGNHYRGTNIMLLWCAVHANGYTSNEWGSFKQWQTANESVRKGEKGNLVVFTSTFEKEVDGEVKEIPFLKYSLVFNKCQLKSYDASKISELEEAKPLDKRAKIAEDFIENTFADITHHDGDAYYEVTEDKIYMPHRGLFRDTNNCTAVENYYSAKFHELTHWTGHPKRLNRPLDNKIGDIAYAKEELTAELGAAFLTAEFGIVQPAKADHAAYISNWLEVLKSNKEFIVSASRNASKAVQFVKDCQPLKF